MAKEENKEKHIKGRFEGLGTYQEATGGGTPIPKGEKLADHPEAKRVLQPRDEDGQFTYNAANKRKLKYGPSRGKTTPPYLKIMHDSSDGKEGSERKVYYDESGKQGIYNVSEKLAGYDTKDFINDCKEYFGEELYEDYGETSMISRRGNPYQLVLSRLKEGKSIDGGQIDTEEMSNMGMDKEGFKYQTRYADVNAKQKSGRRSKLEQVALASDYKGDLSNKALSLPDMKSKQDVDKGLATWKQTGRKHPKLAKYIDVNSYKPKIKRSTGSGRPAFGSSDTRLAQTDPAAFQAKYQQDFDEINDMASKAGIRLSPKKLMALITSGQAGSMDEVKEAVRSVVNRKK